MFSKIFIIAVVIFFSLGIKASAVRQLCESYSSNVCGSIQFKSEPSTKSDSVFNLRLSEIPTEQLKVDLWMQMGDHGHGSSPVKMTHLVNGELHVENVWFVMKGKWQVRVHYNLNSEQKTFTFPVIVNE